MMEIILAFSCSVALIEPFQHHQRFMSRSECVQKWLFPRGEMVDVIPKGFGRAMPRLFGFTLQTLPHEILDFADMIFRLHHGMEGPLFEDDLKVQTAMLLELHVLSGGVVVKHGKH